jgi:mRNA interferase MazF
MTALRIERGEVWWASVAERCPVVLLSEDETHEFRAVEIVAPATAAQKRGYVVLSGQEALDARLVQRAITATDIGGVGVEVEIGIPEGLPHKGVVRVALPRDDRIFCTWLVNLTRDSLIERVGTLSATKLGQLANALRLARIE